MRWPFIGEFAGGTQTLTPRVQGVATPPINNLDIPNEDSRAFDLEDSNLFAINRFNGHDRFEDGARITYGLEWNYSRPGFNINSIVGQSYRLTDKPSLFPDGTGLTDRPSRSEEPTSELQSLMPSSYAAFCLTKKTSHT